MKTLTLLRHAKSDWDDPDSRDFDRALNARGKRAAETVGRWLAGERWRCDAAVASPAERVRETLDFVSAGYGARIAPEWDRRVYLASAATLLDVVTDTSDANDRLLLVGHNPGLEDLVLLLAGSGDALGDVAEKFPTASVAILSFAVNRWAEVREGQGCLDHFVRPRDLNPSLGPDSK